MVSNSTKIQVGKENFFKLRDQLIDISFKENISVPKFNNFQITPFSNIVKRLNNYIQSLSAIKTIRFIIDEKLILILKKVQDIYNKNPTKDNERFLLRILGIITGHQFIGPEWFHLDISNPCNIDCNYCWFYSKYLKHPPSNEFKKSMIKYSDFKNLVDDLKDLKTDTILFSGAGEPFLHPNIRDMITYVKTSNIRLQIFTNGTKLDDKNIKNIIDNCVDEILISVSASNPHTYIKVHPKQGKKTFFDIESGIKKLIKLKKQQRSKKPIIHLLFILCKDNYKDIIEMADWSSKLGVETIRYQLAHNDDAKQIELTKNQIEYAKIQVEFVIEKYRNKSFHVTPNILFQLENTDLNTEWYSHHYKNKGCYVGWYFSRIWADSKISFCCIRKEVEHYKRKNSFKSLWNSEKYKNYRNAAKSFGKKNIQLKRNYYLIDKDCSHCGNYEVNEKVYSFLKENSLLKFL